MCFLLALSLRLLFELLLDLGLPGEIPPEAPLNLLSAVMLLQELDLGLLSWPAEFHLVSLPLDRLAVVAGLTAVGAARFAPVDGGFDGIISVTLGYRDTQVTGRQDLRLDRRVHLVWRMLVVDVSCPSFRRRCGLPRDS